MKIIDSILPRYTTRRLVATSLVHALTGKGNLRGRLVSNNFAYYRQYRNSEFFCNVCAESGTPFFDFPDLVRRREHGIGFLRETLQCRHCGGTMRHRTLAAGILQVLSERTNKTFKSIRELADAAPSGCSILDTDAFSPISRLLRRFPGYMISSFHPDKPFDQDIAPGHINVNLERMGFAPQSFDIVLTSDVMEHVRDIEAAHAEISRILRPGGRYIFTVPYDETIETHRVLVDTTGAKDIFLVEPHYHGDPISGGILAYRIFGRELFKELERTGLELKFQMIEDAACLIHSGDLFIAIKPH